MTGPVVEDIHVPCVTSTDRVCRERHWNGGIVQRGLNVRAIEYEIVSASRVARVRMAHTAITEFLGDVTQVAMVRCVDSRGSKLTAFGDSDQMRRLLASGEASNPAGMVLSQQTFPVVLPGWLHDL
jgi:hypothetical protein